MKHKKSLLLISILIMVSNLSARIPVEPLPSSKYKALETLVSNCPIKDFYASTQDSSYNQYVISGSYRGDENSRYYYDMYKITSSNGICTKFITLKSNTYIDYDTTNLVVDSKRKFIYISSNNKIARFNFNGNLINQWNKAGSATMGEISSLTIDSYGNLYVADIGTHNIHKFSASGKFLLRWGGRGEYDGRFNIPISIAIDKHNKVYVADKYNYRIQKFDSSGNFISKWGHKLLANDSSEIYGFTELSNIAVDVKLNVFVTDETGKNSNHRKIKMFRDNGDYINESTLNAMEFEVSSRALKSLHIDHLGNIYVLNRNTLFKFNKYYNHVDAWGAKGSHYGKGGVYNTRGILFDSYNNMYILTDGYQFKRIQKFSKNGKFISQWGSVGSRPGQFGSCRMAINSANEIYVLDTDNHRIQRFNINGKLLQIIDISKDLSIYPNGDTAEGGIAIDKNNNIYYIAFGGVVKTTESERDIVHVYNRYGKHLKKFKINDAAFSNNIYIDKKRSSLYLIIDNEISKYNLNGKLLTGWGVPSSDIIINQINGEILSVYDKDIGKHYNITHINSYSSSGNFIGTEVTNRQSISKFIAIDKFGSTYLTDSYRVYKKEINPDIDHDGVPNGKDAFPFNRYEWLDTDHDGIGNNADKDDDNDGLSDTIEKKYKLNPLNASDAKADFDHDGFSNALEISIGTNIRNKKSKPIWAPIIMNDIMVIVATRP